MYIADVGFRYEDECMRTWEFSSMKHRRAGLVVTLLAAAALGGCAMTAEECGRTDWLAQGMRDGGQGETRGQFGRYREQCGKFGIAPDHDAWERGWEQGNAQYCLPDNGYAVGRRGYGYQGVCQGAGSYAFMQAYERGRAIYRYEQQMQQLQDEIRQAERERYGLYQRLGDDKSDRDAVRYQLMHLDNRLNMLQSQLMQLQFSRPAMQAPQEMERPWLLP